MFILLRVANRPSDDRMMYVRDTGMTKLRTHTRSHEFRHKFIIVLELVGILGIARP